MKLQEMALSARKPEHKINPVILGRWSPRAMSGGEIAENELMPLFEAAKWAPSSYNAQPWRFLYARRNTEHWDTFLNLLVEGNKKWARNAAVLVVVISRKTFEVNGTPSKTHSFDSGAAWENLAIEAVSRDLVVHGMEGFDYGKARKQLEIPDGYEVEAMIAIGKRGSRDIEAQPAESPGGRRPLKEIMMEGKFRESA
ncbi:nitroreductase family protein [Candidatus Woesearchaeota archaeon]|nr:nitroreductase family protein [Candidatus Woesearchaeota archaeon]